MRNSCGRDSRSADRRERGGARLNFVIVVVVVAALGYAGYHTIPTLYHARTYETFMQDTVNNAALMSKNPAWVEQQLKDSLDDYELPTDATVKSIVRDGRLEAQVRFTRTIPLLVTSYDYVFDKTVRSSTSVMGG
jgi:hypothetical protein